MMIKQSHDNHHPGEETENSASLPEGTLVLSPNHYLLPPPPKAVLFLTP